MIWWPSSMASPILGRAGPTSPRSIANLKCITIRVLPLTLHPLPRGEGWDEGDTPLPRSAGVCLRLLVPVYSPARLGAGPCSGRRADPFRMCDSFLGRRLPLKRETCRRRRTVRLYPQPSLRGKLYDWNGVLRRPVGLAFAALGPRPDRRLCVGVWHRLSGQGPRGGKRTRSEPRRTVPALCPARAAV